MNKDPDSVDGIMSIHTFVPGDREAAMPTARYSKLAFLPGCPAIVSSGGPAVLKKKSLA